MYSLLLSKIYITPMVYSSLKHERMMQEIKGLGLRCFVQATLKRINSTRYVACKETCLFSLHDNAMCESDTNVKISHEDNKERRI